MRIASFVPPFCILCFFTLAANSYAEDRVVQSSSPVEVVYIVTGSTIQTYNVDASTGIPTQKGPALTLPYNAPYVTPSHDGHFLYVQGSYNMFHISVYATNSAGVPKFPPVQSLAIPRVLGILQFDPDGKFAYAVQSTADSSGNTLAAMRLFNVDPGSGMLNEDPNVVTTYPGNGPCVQGSQASLQIAGFNPSGSRLYEYWGCSYPGNTGAFYYYTQQVDQLTGALGPFVQTLAADSSDLQSPRIYITPKFFLVFDSNFVGPPGSNSLNIYPLNGGATPILTCTTSMLSACGYGLSAIPDLSGNFVFLNLSDADTEIADVDVTGKTITATGYSVLGSRQYFSPDDRLVYSEVSTACTANCSIYIYNFDRSSGAVTTEAGSIINAQIYPSSVVPALRK